jgi:hypothetical protein
MNAVVEGRYAPPVRVAPFTWHGEDAYATDLDVEIV